jgi:hypothetical protein
MYQVDSVSPHSKKQQQQQQFNFLFIYLCAELNSHLSITESARIQTATAMRKHRTKKEDQPRLFTLKHELLKTSVRLQTAFAAEAHLAEGQGLEEHVNMVKLTNVPSTTTVSKTERQHLVPLNTFCPSHNSTPRKSKSKSHYD